MKGKILGLLAALTVAGAMAANAQTETLVYSEGVFSGNVTLSQPLPQNGSDISVSPREFNVPQIGFGASYDYICPSCGYALGGMSEYGGASFSFTTLNGHISAWDVDINFTGTPGTNTQTSLYASISPLSDSFTQLTFGAACAPQPGQPSPCQPTTVTSGKRGVWTTSAAPEMDPASAAGGLTLLLGGLLVLSGRRMCEAQAI